MALSHLLKFVYNNGTDEVIRRGKKIHQLGFLELTHHDDLTNGVSFRVKDDIYNTYYRVNIQRYTDPSAMSVRCTCPYNLSELCRHEAAALLRLQEMIDKHLVKSHNMHYDQRHTEVKMKMIDLKTIRMFSSPEIVKQAEAMLRTNPANILKAENEKVEAELHVNGQSFPLIIQKNEERNFDTSCRCNEIDHPLCEHKVLLFLQLLHNYGPNYFDSIRNWQKEQEKLLNIYGYSLKDNLEGKFEFIYKEGKPFLKVLDPSIKRVVQSTTTTTAPPKEEPKIPAGTPINIPEKQQPAKKAKQVKLGLVINFHQKSFPFFTTDLIMGEANDAGDILMTQVEKLDLTKFVDTDPFTEDDKMLFQQVRKLQDAEINKYLNRNSPFSGIWDNIITDENEELPEETRRLITEYIYPRLHRLFAELRTSNNTFILREQKTFITANLEKIQLNDHVVRPSFFVGMENGKPEMHIKADGGYYTSALKDNESPSPLLYMNGGRLSLWENVHDVFEIENLQKQIKNLPEDMPLQDVLKTVALPLAEKYKLDFDRSLVKDIQGIMPGFRIMMEERGNYLVLRPVFEYGHTEVSANADAIIYDVKDGSVQRIFRNKEAESNFLDKIKNLHSRFIFQEETGSLILKGDDVLKDNWFFLFTDAIRDMKVPLYGMETLRNFRFNSSRPGTHIYLSSGTDWFDAKVEVNFGDQKVSIQDIKNALSQRQNFIPLGDGTLGILPEEWLKKYSLLFKVGQTTNAADKLKLGKYHLGVIDELYEQRDEEELTLALDDKFEKLRDFRNIEQSEVPQNVQATLRPYQIAGYQWLNYLHEVQWGGILADDMGLGKTLQALTMLQSYKNKNGSLVSIVVCPTTLIYNWKNEINKFTPDITYTIHHGNQRARKVSQFKDQEIIITTYGTLRSDIELLLQLNFDYIVLDESQAIKNPSSKVARAAVLLRGKHRICMSGTPLQNNTFDIYSQMNFLNPGLLGSVEFFRNEFATPIDKFGEEEQKNHLRKLLYPFILRRTKDQVAKDLPEKTETILYCEMESEQRRIYDAYRNTYREKILGTIDEQGIEKSQMTILQGLMKLRQICDSPAILREDEIMPNYSIKLTELERELTENIGEHKVLIFSQFLGMLALIREKLRHLKIEHEYFDGSTAAGERERAIRNFQENDQCRVFLISLKAGGVGLNLTAADYVYIVDPWWNPAVEQQAIDRTHRIGQSKNIFAYRMICVDTIEDKILQLQEKKRSLAKELISDDTHVVKTLTRDDIEYLFS